MQIRTRHHYTTTSEWPKSRTLTIPNAGKDMEQQEHSFTGGGNVNGIATLKDSLGISHKTEHTVNHMIQKSLSLEFAKGVKN